MRGLNQSAAAPLHASSAVEWVLDEVAQSNAELFHEEGASLARREQHMMVKTHPSWPRVVLRDVAEQ